MDSEVTLTDIRVLAEEILNGEMPVPPAAARELAGLIQDLDTFLCKGGHIPADWRPF